MTLNPNLRTYIELNKSALEQNIKQIKRVLGQTEIAAVVKSNAYGHGVHQIAFMLAQNDNISWICTAGIKEALELKKFGIKKQILVLSFFDDELELAIKLGIHLCVYNSEDLDLLAAAARRINCIVNVHIKIETGMSRLGVEPDDILEFVKKLSEFRNIKLYGIFTHLCDVPNIDQSFSDYQIKQFNQVIDMLSEIGIKIPCTHLQSSSALYIKLERRYSFARIGGFLYGLWKSPDHKKLVEQFYPDFQLQPVLTWKTKVVQIKKIPKGAFVGYGKTFMAQRDSILAILPVGYFDGYPRILSNKAFVSVQDKLVPVVGIISMNLMAIDIADLKNVKLHDEVTLVGNQKGITAQEIAQCGMLITNEFVTRINSNIARFIL